MIFRSFLLVFLLSICLSSASNEYFVDVNIDIIINKTCDYSISLKSDKTIYETSEKIEFFNHINPKPELFIITYWIEYLNGTIVKKKISTNNLNKKTYTPKKTYEKQVLIIRNQLLVNCSNQGTNKSEIIMIVNPSSQNENTTKSMENNSLEEIKNNDVLSYSNHSLNPFFSSQNISNKISGMSVYESDSQKNLDLIPIIIVFALLVLVLIVILKKKF